MTIQPCSDPAVVEAVGAENLNDTKVSTASVINSDDPETQLYKAIMAKYAPDTDIEGFAIIGYQGTLGLVRATEAVQGGTDTSPAALTAAIKSATGCSAPPRRLRADLHLRRQGDAGHAVGVRQRRHHRHLQGRRARRPPSSSESGERSPHPPNDRKSVDDPRYSVLAPRARQRRCLRSIGARPGHDLPEFGCGELRHRGGHRAVHRVHLRVPTRRRASHPDHGGVPQDN